MKKTPKWEIEFMERISKLTNRELFDEYVESIQPDDYDGCHTSRGAAMCSILGEVVQIRLRVWLEDKSIPQNKPVCQNSDCADRYGDPDAWCLKCQEKKEAEAK